MTSRNEGAIKAINKHVDTWGIPPTIMELAEEMGCSVGTIFTILRELEAEGTIRRQEAKHRSIFVVRDK